MARTIKGTITSSVDGKPVANALVKAFDSDVDGDDVMGEDSTDSNGRYSIGYRGGDWDPSPSSNVTIWRPDIYLKVFLPNNFGQLVQVKKSRTYDDHRLRNDLTIDLTVTPPLPTARTIHGLITDQTTGNPLPDALVRAFDRDPGGDKPMGEATSDSSGKYQIAYAGGHWDPSPSHDVTVWRPDIYLQVFVKNVAGQYIQVKQTQEYSNQRLRESLQVDIPVTPRPYARTVRGTMTWAGGGPVVGAAVRAYDSDELKVGDLDLLPTGNRLMGEAVTDSTGSYLLTYAEGHWDPALHSITTWRPDIFIDVDLGGYVWRSPVSDNVPHRDGCQISMQVEPPLLMFPFFSGANNFVKLWVGWFGVRAPEQLIVEYKEQGQTATKLAFSGTWRVVGKAKRRRFFCNTATIQVAPNKDYEVTGYINAVQNLVGWATFRSLPATLSSLSSGQTFNILLGSCYYYEFDQGRTAAAHAKIVNSANRPHLNILCGDQVYLDAPWSNFVQRHDTDTLYDILTRRYRYSLETSMGKIMGGAVNINTSEDHEFWNNYPLPAFYSPALSDPDYRRTWRRIALELFTELQCGHPVQIVNLNEMSVFVADTRINRGDPGASGAFMLDGDMSRLTTWVAGLKGPGILVLGQPLFDKPGGTMGLFKDYYLSDYAQYNRLVETLWNSRHDVVVLCGDVHFGRIGSCVLGSGKKLIEIISSPLSQIPDANHRWKLGVDNDPATFPRQPIGSIGTPAKITYHHAVSPKPNHDDRTAENFFTLSFKLNNAGTIDMSVAAWLPRQPSSGPLPHQDFQWPMNLT